jgi:chromosome segregation ATPase
MVDEGFYREFKEVYQAINIIGKEIMALKDKIEKIDNNINEIKEKIDSCCQKPQSQPQPQESPEEDPERKAAHDKYVRSRTGDFEPGDKDIDVNNVFYAGSKKRV